MSDCTLHELFFALIWRGKKSRLFRGSRKGVLRVVCVYGVNGEAFVPTIIVATGEMARNSGSSVVYGKVGGKVSETGPDAVCHGCKRVFPLM